MEDCIFCKIIAGNIPSAKVYEDEFIYAFKDINPKAAVHLLVIPKNHIESMERLSNNHASLISHMVLKLSDIAQSQGLTTGFRTIINTGPGGGQEVNHLHMHILGGHNLAHFN